MRRNHIFFLSKNQISDMIKEIKIILSIYKNVGCGEIIYYDPFDEYNDMIVKLFENNNIKYTLFTQKTGFSKTEFSKFIEDLYRGDIFEDAFNMQPMILLINNIPIEGIEDYFENYRSIIEIMNIFIFIFEEGI